METTISAEPKPTLGRISAFSKPRQRRGTTAKHCAATLIAPLAGQPQAPTSEIIETIQAALTDALIAAWERDQRTTEPKGAAA